MAKTYHTSQLATLLGVSGSDMHRRLKQAGFKPVSAIKTASRTYRAWGTPAYEWVTQLKAEREAPPPAPAPEAPPPVEPTPPARDVLVSGGELGKVQTTDFKALIDQFKRTPMVPVPFPPSPPLAMSPAVASALIAQINRIETALNLVLDHLTTLAVKQ